MWHSLSIRSQLFALTSFMLLGLTLATLSLTYWLDQKQREALAIDLSQTLNNSLSHDMLKALVSNETDVFSDLSFRLSQFNSVDRVLLYNDQHQAVFEYKSKPTYKYDQLIAKATEEPRFSGVNLYVKRPLAVDEYTFGEVVYIIDMHDLTTQLNEHLIYLIIAFPLELLIGFFLTLRLSRLYSRPFETLASAMKNSQPGKNIFPILSTTSQNEVKSLFDGFNQMMSQISTTTEQLRYQAERDQLTGLYNQQGFQTKLDHFLHAEDQPVVTRHILLQIDLDQFKLINDSVGHVAGDELLKMIATSCAADLPKNSILARTGGDDFMILIPNCSLEEGTQQAQKTLATLKDFRFIWEGESLSVSASMGLVAFKPFEYTLEGLSKAADSAFYAAKSAGRNQLHIYQPGDSSTQKFDRDIEVAGFIKEALGDGPSRFELFAQAIVPLQTESTKIGYEILLRLWDNKGNFIPPDFFLPTAERYQMMAEIDMFVLWTFLETVTQHPEHIQNLHAAHVNLAGGSLNNHAFQVKVKQAIDFFDFPWEKLSLELTETSAVGNLTKASDFIQYCKNQHIGFALDDFGTGMSSFEYLKNLPFDVVKIDGSFVKDMHTDPTDKAVIRYIQEISALRNQETVAEYIETMEDVKVLTEIGITYGQGYYLGKPKPLTEWLNP
ncbi:putative bifunctional diguanylate cyclase/phosphodiesterase [Thiomicrorhabdus arctica]|jgi:diguanylate cyclase (GGDEF)-like protein|uniref:putative bifunctional diguanylate cyclase/phosphodiesterase n=1 Tax=Thiomicrorhabdus arctica TaxID=131540 RepID=UPI000362300D|nr:EAL domain-containing protein [Thiomicrorhabdus arctica]